MIYRVYYGICEVGYRVYVVVRHNMVLNGGMVWHNVGAWSGENGPNNTQLRQDASNNEITKIAKPLYKGPSLI